MDASTPTPTDEHTVDVVFENEELYCKLKQPHNNPKKKAKELTLVERLELFKKKKAEDKKKENKSKPVFRVTSVVPRSESHLYQKKVPKTFKFDEQKNKKSTTSVAKSKSAKTSTTIKSEAKRKPTASKAFNSDTAKVAPLTRTRAQKQDAKIKAQKVTPYKNLKATSTPKPKPPNAKKSATVQKEPSPIKKQADPVCGKLIVTSESDRNTEDETNAVEKPTKNNANENSKEKPKRSRKSQGKSKQKLAVKSQKVFEVENVKESYTITDDKEISGLLNEDKPSSPKTRKRAKSLRKSVRIANMIEEEEEENDDISTPIQTTKITRKSTPGNALRERPGLMDDLEITFSPEKTSEQRSVRSKLVSRKKEMVVELDKDSIKLQFTPKSKSRKSSRLSAAVIFGSNTESMEIEPEFSVTQKSKKSRLSTAIVDSANAESVKLEQGFSATRKSRKSLRKSLRSSFQDLQIESAVPDQGKTPTKIPKCTPILDAKSEEMDMESNLKKDALQSSRRSTRKQSKSVKGTDNSVKQCLDVDDASKDSSDENIAAVEFHESKKKPRKSRRKSSVPDASTLNNKSTIENLALPARLSRKSLRKSTTSTRILKTESDEEINEDINTDNLSTKIKSRRSTRSQNLDIQLKTEYESSAKKVYEDNSRFNEGILTPLSNRQIVKSPPSKKRKIYPDLDTTGNDFETGDNSSPSNSGRRILRSSKRSGNRGRASSQRLPRHKRRSRRSSSGKRSNDGNRFRESTLVSVSDEGTGLVLGKDVIGTIDPDRCSLISPSPNAENRSMRRERQLSGSTPTRPSEPLVPVAYLVASSKEGNLEERALQELTVEKVEGESSCYEISLEDSLNKSSSSSSENNGTEGFTPQHVSNDAQSSDRDLITFTATPPQTATPSRTATPSQSSQLVDIFKTPGQPMSSLLSGSGSSRSRRKSESCPRTPEEMVEILRNSPMVQMNRRRNRHVSAPGKSTESTPSDKFNVDTSKKNVSYNCERDKPEGHSRNSDEPEITADPVLAEVKEIEQTETRISESEGAFSTEAMDISDPVCSVTTPETDVETKTAVLDDCDMLKCDEVMVDEDAEKVQPFRTLVESETARINQMCSEWTNILKESPDLSEDVVNEIDCVIGKAQLLITKKFKQFSGLIDNCQYGLGEKETNTMDLQGFWEMMYSQVEDIEKKFKNIQEMKENNWQEKKESPKKGLKKKKAGGKAVAKGKVTSHFAQFKAEMKKRKAAEKDGAAQESKETENKEINFGFFSVLSPVKKFESDDDKSENEKKEAIGTPSKQTGEEVAATSGKENQGTPQGLFLPKPTFSARRSNYLPARPSPLLNDITHYSYKKSRKSNAK